jgi:hypothetical protein
MDKIVDWVLETMVAGLLILVVVCVAGTFYKAFTAPEPTRYGNNAVLYNKAFNQCVGMLGIIPRNVSTVEDDDTSDMLSQCNSAADSSSRCVYNGKGCI